MAIYIFPDIDECATYNNTCSQTCVNLKGTYECTCADNFTDAVHVGGMRGRDCRADGKFLISVYDSYDRSLAALLGPPAEILLGKEGRVDMLPMSSGGDVVVNAIKPEGNNATDGSVIAIDYHPFRSMSQVRSRPLECCSFFSFRLDLLDRRSHLLVVVVGYSDWEPDRERNEDQPKHVGRI